MGVEAEVIQKMANLPLADSALNAPAAEFGGVEFYDVWVSQRLKEAMPEVGQ